MVTLQAPVGAASQTTTFLPNPDLGDQEEPFCEVNYREAISGKPWVYSRRGKFKKITFTWSTLGRGKLVEITEFLKLHIADKILVTDHNDRKWLGNYDLDSIDVVTDLRNANHGPGRQEGGNITLTFVVQEIN